MSNIAFEDAVEQPPVWYFRIIIGPFATKEDADRAAIELSKQLELPQDVAPLPLGVFTQEIVRAADKVG